MSESRRALVVLVGFSCGLSALVAGVGFPPASSPRPLAVSLPGQAATLGPPYDVVIRGGLVIDGSGRLGTRADVAVREGRVAAIGDLGDAAAAGVVDARNRVVAPGFINMLSWSTESLLVDGRSLGEVKQGVTTQVMGEGSSMGPLSDVMKVRMREAQTSLRYDITWTTLSEYLRGLEQRGVSQNVASFIGAATIREHVVGLDDRRPTARELQRMRRLVEDEMRAGALGIGTSLIYAPGTYADTSEIIALCRVAARYQGKYITHLRSEGARFTEAVDEFLRITREAGLPGEIYHLKAAGEANWPAMDAVLEKIERARAAGEHVTANMYTYTAGATQLDASMPPWALDGGFEALQTRLRDPDERARIAREMREPTGQWESLYLAAGSPDRVRLISFRSEALKPLTGRTLAEVARERGTDPIDTILDLVRQDQSLIGAVYFMMSEENLEKQMRRPWVSFGSDAQSMATEPPFTDSSTHPRAYGNFARLLGHYVRERRVISLEEAVRRLTSLPADNLGWRDRGRLLPGAWADIVVFDPATIADRATFDQPHQYAVGVDHVWVNGVQVLRHGEHTGAKPGRALWGPGKVQ